ncbi:MAG: DUF2062 domain-containing protein [Desulfuromonadales bacterium]|nr:DUF2062 domain-containing protein [Desulfuromonadales bacterium]
MWRRWSFLRQFKLNLIRLIRLRAEPNDIAKGMALGLFIGMTPTFGFQMPLALAFAMLLKENKIAALIGVWVTNPLTAPVIYGLEYEIGRAMMGMSRPDIYVFFNYESFTELGSEIMVPLCLGSLVFGLVVSAVGYAVTLRMVPLAKQWRVPRWPRRRIFPPKKS